MLCIDFKMAFDFVWHEGLFLKLLENGIGGRFYDLIICDMICAVKLSGHVYNSILFIQQRRKSRLHSKSNLYLFINELLKLLEPRTHLYFQMELY